MFKGYLACLDKEFIAYIRRKQENYEEGNEMGLAGTKFKIPKEKGTWNAPPPEEEKILALEGQVKSLKKGINNKAGPGKQGGKGILTSPLQDQGKARLDVQRTTSTPTQEA